MKKALFIFVLLFFYFIVSIFAGCQSLKVTSPVSVVIYDIGERKNSFIYYGQSISKNWYIAFYSNDTVNINDTLKIVDYGGDIKILNK